MNVSIIFLISNEIRRNYQSIEHILVIVIPHNTCTLPKTKSDTYRMINIFSFY